jgi:hypothetical protein
LGTVGVGSSAVVGLGLGAVRCARPLARAVELGSVREGGSKGAIGARAGSACSAGGRAGRLGRMANVQGHVGPGAWARARLGRGLRAGAARPARCACASREKQGREKREKRENRGGRGTQGAVVGIFLVARLLGF